MDYKKVKTEHTAVTRDVENFRKDTGNIYETISLLAKRSNQIGAELKEELNAKLSEFITHTDSLDEVFENREQIEVARFYEQLPKPTLISIHEYLNDKIYYRNPIKEQSGEKSF
jgi:hypothetical protein